MAGVKILSFKARNPHHYRRYDIFKHVHYHCTLYVWHISNTYTHIFHPTSFKS